MDAGSGRAAGAAAVKVELPRWWLHEHLARLVEERVRWYRGRVLPIARRPAAEDEDGLKGEAGMLLWLRANGFRLGERRSAPVGDVLAGRPGPPWLRIDVESWPTPDLRRLGMHVPAWQLARSVGHAWLVVWTSVEGAVVTLNGWTTAATVLDSGLCGAPEDSAGIAAERLRSMDQLAGELGRVTPRAAPRAPTSPRRRR